MEVELSQWKVKDINKNYPPSLSPHSRSKKHHRCQYIFISQRKRKCISKRFSKQPLTSPLLPHRNPQGQGNSLLMGKRVVLCIMGHLVVLYALEISMPVMTIDELLEGSGIKEVRDIKQNKQTKKN